MTPNPTVFLSASGGIALEIPSVLAEGRSHVVDIPLTFAGLSLLKKILQDRQKAEGRKSIGTMSSPVAADVQKYLARRDTEDRAASKKSASELVKKYELEDIELEL
jgi:hypothetical protein